MSAVTITPGLAWSGNNLTEANLDLAANPTGTIGAGTITSIELDTAEVTAALSDGFRGDTFVHNGLLDHWADTSAAGISTARAQIETITAVADASANLDGTYIALSDEDGTIGLWIDVDDSGTTIPAGASALDRGIEVTGITTDMSAAEVAGQLAKTLEADTKFTATSNGAVVTVKHVTRGAVGDAANGAQSPGFTYSVVANGADTGVRTANAVGWFVQTAGAPVDYARANRDLTPAVDSANAYKWTYAAKLTGATGATTVEMGQFISSQWGAKMRKGNISISVFVDNLTQADLTVDYDIRPATTADDASTTSSSSTGSLTAISNGAGWTRLTKVVDVSAVSDIENGFDLVFKIPSGSLDDVGKIVYFAGFQLEISDAATGLINSREEQPRSHSVINRSAQPATTNDTDEGYDTGSRWTMTDGRVYRCETAFPNSARWRLLGSSKVSIVRRTSTTTRAEQSTTNTFPLDTTIPQNTEGEEAFTHIHRPSSADSILMVHVYVAQMFSSNVGMIVLFTDDDADAVATAAIGTGRTPADLRYEFSPGSTDPIEFKLRYGSNTGTTFFLTNTSGKLWGESNQAIIEVIEYQPLDE